ncbi:hypothetical protein L861_14675 [Litchfieldella anticariensis FP35 = DSM 16096]|uniref:Type II secretion system protein J n=1 Tax=Litchfieldella anticariensis (strain DSM 16096 / CECT 5854 / CIP 108499 / LMG 22089 / FP35) TaxID=1121939 RepID=S2L5Y0_LITA3|nr:prepilin-type N-terminal cleavage/methylation domain-containing protein [Halomonas anticariensis]EPC00171.1 hypothetical protein L861_14675 [Halomonas anticariensis FP35 = DSM 16096]
MRSLSQRQRQRRQTGFTLLELLFAMLLMTVLLLISWQAISQARKASENIVRLNEQEEEVRTAQNYLRQTIMEAMNHAIDAGSRRQRQVFIGETTRLNFVAPLPNRFGSLGPLSQELRLLPTQEGQEAEAGRRLQLTLRTAPPEPPPSIQAPPWEEQRDLLHGIETLAFRYLGWSEYGEPDAWRNDWPWPDRLPMAVRISVTFTDGRRWPVLTIPLRHSEAGYW